MKNNQKGRSQFDKKEYLRESIHLTRAPRMEGKVQKSKMSAKKKSKKG